VPKVVDHDRRRTELAEAVARVVAAVGVEKATVRAIAAEAGCSTGVLAHYFDGKHDILLRGLEWANQRLIDRIRDAFESLETLDDLATLARSGLPLDGQSQLEWRVRLHFWSYASSRGELRDYHRDQIGMWRRDVVEAVRAAQQRGIVRNDADAHHIAATLVSVVFGIGVQLVFEPPDVREQMAAALDSYVASLAPAPTSRRR
jgi:AcrR family transcriptional regulator